VRRTKLLSADAKFRNGILISSSVTSALNYAFVQKNISRPNVAYSESAI
jgi:hypothetical protein